MLSVENGPWLLVSVFFVRHRVELAELLAPAGGEDAGGEFVLGGVIAGGFGERDAVVGVVCQAHAVAVGLEAVVAVALHAWRSGADAGEDAGVGVAGDFVGADGFVEPVGVVEDADLDAVPGFVVDAVGLAADVVVDAGGGDEVALVGGVDEHLAVVGFAGEGADRGDACAVFGFGDAVFGAVEPLVTVDGDVVLFDEVFEDLFGGVGFEDPHGAVGAVDGGGALAFVAVAGAVLPGPVFLIVVVEPEAVVELAGEAADDGFVAGVGEAEAAGGESAEVLVGADDDD